MINSRASLAEYALKKLGQGAIDINITEDQIEDRLDEGLQIMQERHLAGSEKCYLKHQITASSLLLTAPVAATFLGRTKITGAISGATATIVEFGTSGSTLAIKGIVGTFIAGETISADSITAQLSSASNFLTLGDTENGFITLPDTVISVLNMLQMTNQSGNGSTNPFDLTYQLRSNDLYNLSSTSTIYYTQVMQHLALIDMTLVGMKPIRFNQHNRKLFITLDWLNYVSAGEYIMIECYRILDLNTDTNVYNNLWLKAYVTALFKEQWGSNLSKYDKIILPGGVTLNGIVIYEQALAEKEKLMEELKTKWECPPDFFLG